MVTKFSTAHIQGLVFLPASYTVCTYSYDSFPLLCSDFFCLVAFGFNICTGKVCCLSNAFLNLGFRWNLDSDMGIGWLIDLFLGNRLGVDQGSVFRLNSNLESG